MGTIEICSIIIAFFITYVCREGIFGKKSAEWSIWKFIEHVWWWGCGISFTLAGIYIIITAFATK